MNALATLPSFISAWLSSEDAAFQSHLLRGILLSARVASSSEANAIVWDTILHVERHEKNACKYSPIAVGQTPMDLRLLVLYDLLLLSDRAVAYYKRCGSPQLVARGSVSNFEAGRIVLRSLIAANQLLEAGRLWHDPAVYAKSVAHGASRMASDSEDHYEWIARRELAMIECGPLVIALCIADRLDDAVATLAAFRNTPASEALWHCLSEWIILNAISMPNSCSKRIMQALNT